MAHKRNEYGYDADDEESKLSEFGCDPLLESGLCGHWYLASLCVFGLPRHQLDAADALDHQLDNGNDDGYEEESKFGSDPLLLLESDSPLLLQTRI